MTNHWIDIGNSDCIMIIGSNAAENHPISFKYVTKAMENGAKLISADPRFTRTSSKADIYARFRPGTDIPFIGGMIRYAIHNNRVNEDYVKEYTNAPMLVDAGFKKPGDSGQDGVFSGLSGTYDKSTWQYATYKVNVAADGDPPDYEKRYVEVTGQDLSYTNKLDYALSELESVDGGTITRHDDELNADVTFAGCRPVWAHAKEHFDRYDLTTVLDATGSDEAAYVAACDEYTKTGQVGKAGTIMYAMGTTQHTVGTQNIRSYAILQLLLGNMGVAGGGINALRGESNVQGSTDHCLLFHILPGYLKQPGFAGKDNSTLDKYLDCWAPKKLGDAELNWWKRANYKAYIVSLLKDYFGANAVAANSFGYGWLPRLNGLSYGNNASHITIFEEMGAGKIKGLLCMGQNPAVGGPNANDERSALEKLDFLVVADLWETETASFWKRPLANSAAINTEVFLLPAAASYEKEGSITNSGRWIQWRYPAKTPPGDAKHDLGIVYELGKEIKAIHPVNAQNVAINNLNWYASEPTADQICEDINGWNLVSGVKDSLVVNFTKLKSDGTTTSLNWLYCGMYMNDDKTMSTVCHAKRTSMVDGIFNIGLYPSFSWCWPINRRIIYNGASVQTDGNGSHTGQPWDTEHPVIQYNTDNAWNYDGDIPDGVAGPGSERGMFIMKPEGHARIHGMGRADGPLPEHYEPKETPLTANPMGHGTLTSPVIEMYGHTPGDVSEYPCIATTYRVTEHWQAGAMTRNLPWLCELMPNMFCEISETLAASMPGGAVSNKDKVIITTARGEIEAIACVTDRMKPVNDTEVVGLVWHYGYAGIAKGDSANRLTPHWGCANTRIPEYKAFLCKVRKA